MADPAIEPITIGFSPCPNDTFAFHALVHELTVESGLVFAPPLLADVETLNEWAMGGHLDVTKLSCHALGHVCDDYVLLQAGSALGRGCGPLLISRRPLARHHLPDLRVAVPGRFTTAAMLLKLYEPGCRNLVFMRFEEIMPAIARGEVDAGVVIHESRFTYEEKGFVLHTDLGAWWEETSGCPIPLGGIAARRSMGRDKISLVEKAIRKSVQYALINPDVSREFIKGHAQEIDEKVICDHIGLYVNDFTIDLGREGRNAIEVFLARGREAGILPDSSAMSCFLSL